MTRTIRLALIAAAIAITMLVVGFYLFNQWRGAAKNGQVATGQAGSGMNSTGVAFNTMDTADKRDAETDATVNAGKAQIDAAPPGKRNDAAIEAACKLPAYKDTPRCAP
jgi:archaellin